MLNTKWTNVATSLNLHDHSLGVGKVWSVSERRESVSAHHLVQLLLHLLLHTWIPDHVEDGPGEGGGGGLRPRQEQIKQIHLQIVQALLSVET